jgi:hypothetical protein
MKILIATKDTQGKRKNDFCFVPEGEPVIPPWITCSNEKADDSCGCQRSMSGIFCHKATTTVKVFDAAITSEELKWAVIKSYVDAGWPVDARTPTMVSDLVDELLAEADKHRTETVLEFRDGRFAAR